MVFVMPSRHCVVPLANHFLSNIFLMFLISNVFVILVKVICFRNRSSWECNFHMNYGKHRTKQNEGCLRGSPLSLGENMAHLSEAISGL